MPSTPSPSVPSHRSATRWWRLDLPAPALLDAELAARGDACSLVDWLLSMALPIELSFVIGNAGPWEGLRMGISGLGATAGAARSGLRTVSEGFDDTQEAFGWPLARCEPPGLLPRVALPLSLPEGRRLDRRDGVLDRTRARLATLEGRGRTAALHLTLRLHPTPKVLQDAARTMVVRALRAARSPRSGGAGLPLELAERARDLHSDSVGLQAALAIHLDEVPGPMVLEAIRADLARDLGHRLQWDVARPMAARPTLLPALFALLAAAPVPASPGAAATNRQVLAFPG